MQIQKITRNKNKNYTTLCNVALRDKKLSLKAKGFFAVVMSLPPDWDFSIAGMQKILAEGRHTVYKVLGELIASGYVKRERRYENGKITEWSYVFNDAPELLTEKQEVGDLLTENLEIENLEIENLDVENRTQISKERNKDLKEIITEGEKDPPASAFGPRENDVQNKRFYHPAIKALREISGHNPDPATYPHLIKLFGERFDREKLEGCFVAWRLKGFKSGNFGWATDWYFAGIPEANRNGNGKQSRNGNGDAVDEWRDLAADYGRREVSPDRIDNQQDPNDTRLVDAWPKGHSPDSGGVDRAT